MKCELIALGTGTLTAQKRFSWSLLSQFVRLSGERANREKREWRKWNSRQSTLKKKYKENKKSLHCQVLKTVLTYMIAQPQVHWDLGIDLRDVFIPYWSDDNMRVGVSFAPVTITSVRLL